MKSGQIGLGKNDVIARVDSCQDFAGEKGREAVALFYPSARNGRRFALVSKVLAAMKIHHVAVVPLRKQLGLGRLEKSALKSPYCRTVSRLPSSSRIIIAEANQVPEKHQKTARKRVLLSYDTKGFLGSAKPGKFIFHPILFHPDMIHAAAYQEARELSKNPNRAIGVLFAGNCDEATYTQNDMAGSYGILNRIEIRNLARRFPEKRLFIPGERGQFETALLKGELADKLVWIDTNRFRIPQNEWLELISKSRFFICTPGVQYPYCQNLNEAAACGSVPVLQFPDAYFPALENGMNCLTFDSKNDFSDSISGALDMPEKQWKTLSNGAIGYHEMYLSLDTLHEQLEEFFLDPDARELTWVLAGKTK